MRPFEQLLLLILPSLLSYATIRDIVSHLYSLGKSNSTIKKNRQKYTIKQKFLLYHIKDDDKRYYSKHINFFCMVHTAYIIVFLFSLILVTASFIVADFKMVSFIMVISKLCVMDIPLAIFSLMKSEIDRKHGGRKWKYDKY